MYKAFNTFIDDAFARFAKVTILLSAAAVLAMSQEYMERRGLLRSGRSLRSTLSIQSTAEAAECRGAHGSLGSVRSVAVCTGVLWSTKIVQNAWRSDSALECCVVHGIPRIVRK